jgi:two-component system LytT family response regulator
MPLVIFVTAYSSHAVRAFEVQALDYVLKPIDTERLVQAVARAQTRLGGRRDSRLTVRDRGRLVLLDPDAVTRIEADGDYIRVYASGAAYLVRETLGAMEAKLDRTRFARIHRSLIIQLRHVRQLEPQRNAEFIVTLSDGARVRASRRYSCGLQPLVDRG